ncbi:uncharacterized protein At3g28850 [Telopea speciosissima]|uniref:uncharacterized protein At3g28850 n=1 Tax=Telopea speciosissima TaxID=54955 RepID=UPI001CC3BFB6|nr:uncharacterized protein At3g28850 [Telopea speciosissima]
MGCASSKRIEATLAADVYRPAPTSFAVFDINAIEEPWLKADGPQQQQQQQQQQEKPTIVPAPILEKLDAFDLESKGPHSWSEVSKALEDLKPTIDNNPVVDPQKHSSPKPSDLISSNSKPTPPRKTVSFHTLEELDSKLTSPKPTQLKKADSMTRLNDNKKQHELKKTEPNDSAGGFKPVKENIFILKDRLEREKEGNKNSNLEPRLLTLRREPLSEYAEKCPPGGADSVVLYTTTLRGVRRTFEDCNQARSLLEGHQVAIDERDVSLHGEFLNELRELLGEEGNVIVPVPRLFVKGRYIGGVDEMVELNESGRLGRMMRLVGMNGSWRECEGCGGARFLPCLECGGSCKVLKGDKKERCPKCNENGLVMCPLCH